MKASLLISCAILAVASLDVDADEHVTSDYCACLSQKPAAFFGARDGDFMVSLLVPSQFVRRDSSDTHGESVVVWARDATEIRFRHRAETFKEGLDPAETGDCMVEVNGRRVLVRKHDETRAGFTGRFEPAGGESIKTLDVFAPTLADACRFGANALWSAAFVNDGSKLRLVSIAEDLASFEIVNEVGERKRFRVNDWITKDYGVVTAIHADRVNLIELDRDGRGGWREIDRVLRLTPDTKD